MPAQGLPLQTQFRALSYIINGVTAALLDEKYQVALPTACIIRGEEPWQDILGRFPRLWRPRNGTF